ncbi:MAG TPA: penicillin-binding transpeptidase domain-containing protein [Bacillales bacterium]|nr:penicillin-binding transpeptidase domain-containing protein [Bacillales bacterium]
MKHRKGWLPVLFVFALVWLGGCSNDVPTPEERWHTYVHAWETEQFSDMYELLSTNAKKTISKQKFVDRYKNLGSDLKITDVTIESKAVASESDRKKEKEDGKVKLPFSAQMSTIAGNVTFSEKATLVKETRKTAEGEEQVNWYVDWTTQLIFPQLTGPNIEVHLATLSAERGEILDRNGRPLAVNGQQASVGMEPDRLKTGSKKKFAEITGIPVKQIDDNLHASWVKPNYFVPIVNIPLTEEEKLSKLQAIPGVFIRKIPARIYPYGEAAGHLTGYIGTISAEEWKKHQKDGYDKSDKIGKTGLEAIFENRLRAVDGVEIYTTDQDGNRLQTIAKKAPQDGETVQLTIDAELQKKMYGKFAEDGDVGTAAAINPITGEVLALVTAPDFNPNTIHEDYNALKQNEKQPLINRFIQAYSPGSAMKPITAAIGLETGVIDPDEPMTINGPWQPDSSWGDYRVHRVDHLTSVDLRDALVYSDNIYFARVAYQLGKQRFKNEAKAFGFGQPLPDFPFPIEAAQLTGSDGFSTEIELANSGYGQGKVLISALQLADTYTPFINDGQLLKLTLLKDRVDPSNNVWKEHILSEKTAETIVNDLKQVVQSPNGTGHAANIPGLSIAGKTGTPELKASDKVENGKENGWFVAFNTNDPKILVAMMVENVQNRGGSHYVVPKVAEILNWYLKP